MSRARKLSELGASFPQAWTVISWARELVSEWGSEVNGDDGERLDALDRALDDFGAWLDEPQTTADEAKEK